MLLLAEATAASPAPKDVAAVVSAQPPSTVEAYLLAIAFVVIMLLAVLIATSPPTERDPDADPREVLFRSPGWRFVHSAVLGLLGLAAVWSALPTGPTPLTAAFLSAVVIFALIPVVEKITFPWGGAVDVIKKEIQKDADALTQKSAAFQLTLAQAARVLAELQTQIIDGRLRYTDDRTSMANLTSRIFTTAFPIVAAILVPPPEKDADGKMPTREDARISVFNKTSDPQLLRCSYVWPVSEALKDKPLTIEDDRPSKVYKTGLSVNLPDLASDERPPKRKVEYRGIAIVPILNENGVAGIVIAERDQSERFGPTEMAMLRALAALVSSALLS